MIRKAFRGTGMTTRLPRAMTRPDSRALAPFALLAAVALVAWLAGGTDTPAVDAGMSTPHAVDPPFPPGPTPDLDLLFTAQVAGWIEPCG